MDREQALLQLVGDVYAAGFGAVSWDRVTYQVRDLLGCSVVAIHADDPISGEGLVLSNPGLDPDEAAKYEAYYISQNPWLARAASVVSTGTLFHGEDLVPQRELRRSEYYNDFARPNAIDRALAVCLHCEPDLIAFFSLFKPPDREAFSEDEVEIVRLLSPHLRRAASASRTFQLLRGERRLALEALDLLPRGVALLDAVGQVVFINRQMHSILFDDDGIFISGGRLRFSDSPSQKTFASLLGRPRLDASGGARRVPRPSYGSPYEVVLTPLPGSDGRSAFAPLEGRRGWLLLVVDPDLRRRRPLGRLKRIYGLTDAEAHVADLLAAGRTVRQVAGIRGTSVNTIKSQARAVYGKTRVSSRAELVGRLSELEVGAGLE